MIINLILDILFKTRSTCHSDVVTALIYPKPIREKLSDLWDCLPWSYWYSGVRWCRDEARKHGTCYCGKFSTQEYADTGRLVVNGIEDDDYEFSGRELYPMLDDRKGE